MTSQPTPSSTSEELNPNLLQLLGPNWSFGKSRKTRPPFRTADLTEPIIRLHLIVYPNKTNTSRLFPSKPACNHWLFLLDIAESRAVRFHIDAPSSNLELVGTPQMHTHLDRTGSLELRSLEPERITRLRAKLAHALVFEVSDDPRPTVADVVSMLLYNGRQFFTLSERCEGCRHWCATVIDDMVKERWLEPAALAAAETAMRFYYPFPDPNLTEPRPVARGEFALPAHPRHVWGRGWYTNALMDIVRDEVSQKARAALQEEEVSEEATVVAKTEEGNKVTVVTVKEEEGRL